MYEYRNAGDSVHICLDQLEMILHTMPNRLRAFEEYEFSTPQAPGKWSKKQIIGHLVDSATNNHHRFIRAQFEHEPMVQYDQEAWNKAGQYESMDGEALIAFWELYNRHIHALIEHMSPSMLERKCSFSDGPSQTIAWLFEDYVRHLEHHLKQIFPAG